MRRTPSALRKCGPFWRITTWPTSHGLNLFAGQTYLPAYVRLRMLGCEHYGDALVSHYNGSTSAAAHGCDGAVVPTLVDWETGEVVVDSYRICLHLDD